MRKYNYIMVGFIACLLTLMGVFIANYYTCFTYHLPHKPAIIDVAPGNIIRSVHPEMYLAPDGFNWTVTVCEEGK